MNYKEMKNYIFATLVLITCAMFVWMMGNVSNENVQAPTAIAAFNG